MAFYTLGAIISGILVGKTRLLQPIEFGSGLIAVLGAALIYCIDIGTPKAWWIGAQVPFGLGIGLGNQVPVTALQGFATPETVAATMGVAFSEITFGLGVLQRCLLMSVAWCCVVCQSISGAYFVSAGNSLFNNIMLRRLTVTAPHLSPSQILYMGVTELKNVFRGEELALIRQAYMVGIKDVFAFALAGTVASVVVALVVPFERLPGHEDKMAEDKEAAGKSG